MSLKGLLNHYKPVAPLTMALIALRVKQAYSDDHCCVSDSSFYICHATYEVSLECWHFSPDRKTDGQQLSDIIMQIANYEHLPAEVSRIIQSDYLESFLKSNLEQLFREFNKEDCLRPTFDSCLKTLNLGPQFSPYYLADSGSRAIETYSPQQQKVVAQTMAR